MRLFVVVGLCWCALTGLACSDPATSDGDGAADVGPGPDGGADDGGPGSDGSRLDGSSDASPDGAADGGGDDAGEDGSASDGSEPDGALVVEPRLRGLVELVQRHMGSDSMGYSVTASFVDGESEVICFEETAGPCTAASCTFPVVPTPGTSTLVSAGTLTAGGGLTEVSITPGPMGYEALGMVALWDGGQTLTVAAPGDIAPGFSLELSPPPWPALTAPELPAGSTPLVVDRSEDLLVTWDVSGATTGLVWAELMRSEEADGEVEEWRVRCRWPAGDGSGTISSAMLSTIPAGTAGVVGFSAGDEAETVAEGWTIRAVASEMLASDTRPFASAGATFE